MLPLVALKCVNVPIRTCPVSINHAHVPAHSKTQTGTHLFRPSSILTPTQAISVTRQSLCTQNQSTKSFQRRLSTQSNNNATQTPQQEIQPSSQKPLVSFDGNEPEEISQIATLTPTILESQSKSQSQRMEELIRRVFTPQLLDKLKTKHKLHERIAFRWQKTFKKLLPLGGASEGNELHIFDDGNIAFREMWNAIENAKSRVWMETYIFDPDTVGLRTLQALEKACNNGCDVRLIYDYVGSKKLNNSHLRELRAAGGQATPFNPLTWRTLAIWNMFKITFKRNHRKVLIIDDNIGFCGGMNIGNEYAGKEVGGSAFFRDTHVKVQGPAVSDLVRVFLSTMKEAKLPPPSQMLDAISKAKHRLVPITTKKTEETVPPAPPCPLTTQAKQNIFVQILQSNVRHKRHIQKALKLTLQEAQSHCFFTTPYFLPPQQLKQAIINAAERGVDIRIITCGISDVPVMRWASSHVYHLFLRKGVRIFEYYHSVLHAKTITIDGLYSSIGSYNLDPWSHHYNMELSLTTVDHEVASDLEDQFYKDIEKSMEVTLSDLDKRSIFIRILHWASYHFLRLFL